MQDDGRHFLGNESHDDSELSTPPNELSEQHSSSASTATRAAAAPAPKKVIAPLRSEKDIQEEVFFATPQADETRQEYHNPESTLIMEPLHPHAPLSQAVAPGTIITPKVKRTHRFSILLIIGGLLVMGGVLYYFLQL